MQGESVLKHRNRADIDQMFEQGYTAEQVAGWLKQTHNQNRHLWVSSVSLQHYRKNFLKLSRIDINAKRRELQALGKTHDDNVLSTFTAAKDFIESKNIHTQEILSAINDFKVLKVSIMEKMALMDSETVDSTGKPIFNARSFEVMERFMGRLESVNNSFIKAYKEMNEKSNALNQTNITITTSQIEQQGKLFKEIIKDILMEIDPNLVTKFFVLLQEKMSQQSPQDKSVSIQINNSGDTNNININTEFLTPDEADKENKELQDEAMMENVIDVEADKPSN